MDVSQLTAFLAPFLAPLLAHTQEAAAGAVRTFGEAAWEQAQKLWQHLSDKIADRPAAAETAAEVAKSPDDPRATGALELQLEKILGADPALRDAIAKLWAEGQAAGITVQTVTASGAHSFAAVNVQNSTVNTGTQITSDRREEPPHPKAT
jgi:hypothetical protein